MTPAIYNNMTIEELIKEINRGRVHLSHQNYVLGVLTDKVEQELKELVETYEADIKQLEKEILELQSENSDLYARIASIQHLD